MWKGLHPETSALSWKTEQGWPLSHYDRPAYAEYRRSKKSMFPLSVHSDRLPEKEIVYGVFAGGSYAAILPSEVDSPPAQPIETRVGTVAVRIHPGGADHPVRAEVEEPATDGKGSSHWRDLPLLKSYWFAWYVFHPETTVLSVRSAGTDSR